MSKLHKQTAKLIGRIAENLPEMNGDIMQGWIDDPKELQKFLRGLCPPEGERGVSVEEMCRRLLQVAGESGLVPMASQPSDLSTGDLVSMADLLSTFLGSVENVSVPKETAPLNTIIRVDRSISVFPSWVKKVLHPKLQTVGPAEYDLAKVGLYLHDGQKNGKWMKGTELYDHLKETASLKDCLGLHDALQIQKKGIKVFRKLFRGKSVFCWKSVVCDQGDSIAVPYVIDDGSKVVVDWHWLVADWRGSFPSARFAS